MVTMPQDVRHESALYPYTVPRGFGDSPFIYVYDAQGAGLVDGLNYFYQGVPVDNGDFIMRYVSGWHTILDVTSGSGIQVYDFLARKWFSSVANLGSFTSGLLMPEAWHYPVNGNIRFDLNNVLQASAGSIGDVTVLRSQLAFFGAKRKPNAQSDPVASTYNYYEKDYSIPYTLTISNNAASGGNLLPAVQQQIQIQDFDFELRRVELALQEDEQASQFKILLYDQNKRAISNLPVLSNLFCHLSPAHSSGELAFNPAIPLLYRVNSVIQFDITSLLSNAPQTFHLLFRGVRRIPCS